MCKDFGFELLPRVRISTRSRDAKEVAECVKDFIERILKGQFMTSQDDHTEPPEGEQPLPGEILWTLPTRSDDDRTLQTGADLRHQRFFFF